MVKRGHVEGMGRGVKMRTKILSKGVKGRDNTEQLEG